jgi:hypothetical protein
MSEAFAGHYAASEADTLRHCWHALKVFARFAACDGGVFSAADLTTMWIRTPDPRLSTASSFAPWGPFFWGSRPSMRIGKRGRACLGTEWDHVVLGC